jgi:hypothetical protein
VQRFSGTALDNAGNALAQPTVTVYLGGSTSAATIYGSNVFAALANPFTGNVDGTWEFYARDGRYDVAISKTGYSFGTTVTYDAVLHDPLAVLVPATLGTSTALNNYAPTNGLGYAVWKVGSTNASVDLSGISAPTISTSTALSYGPWLTIVVSSSTGALNLLDQSANSSTGNRIVTGSTATLTLQPSGSARLWYDPLDGVWRVIS